ncbi:hypothetical protein HanIR_Chr11g0543371 [Helianthus annuus]|nr:hypothetical protein HanIR_Chr11g0543371 [Helianthus annuus]
MPCRREALSILRMPTRLHVTTWEFSGRVKGIQLDIVDTTSAQESRCFSSWSIIKTVMH